MPPPVASCLPKISRASLPRPVSTYARYRETSPFIATEAFPAPLCSTHCEFLGETTSPSTTDPGTSGGTTSTDPSPRGPRTAASPNPKKATLLDETTDRDPPRGGQARCADAGNRRRRHDDDGRRLPRAEEQGTTDWVVDPDGDHSSRAEAEAKRAQDLAIRSARGPRSDRLRGMGHLPRQR